MASILCYQFVRYCFNASRRTPLRFLTHSAGHSIRLAIVGSGPAGFYTAQKLLKNPRTLIDIYEKLPVPFGLVRFGVAPDHADVKNVINSFNSIGNNNRVSFLGNIAIGIDISLQELLDNYHIVVLCYGSSQDRMLGIKGEQSSNVISARTFVGWYNGDPHHRDIKLNLDCDTACIIGQGNVAIDCARVLLEPSKLCNTDIASHAQRRLVRSRIRNVNIIGRRGPFQVSFTTKELRELAKLPNCNLHVDLSNLPESIHHLNDNMRSSLPRNRKRLTELIYEKSQIATSTGDNKQCNVRFMLTPTEIVPSSDHDLVDKVKFVRNVFDCSDPTDPQAKIKPTEIIDEMKCGLVIRSIGFKATLIDESLPYDRRKGALVNVGGRIQGFNQLYCSGWLSTGATGVIVDTLNSSSVTSSTIQNDIEQNLIDDIHMEKPGKDYVLGKLRQRNVQIVHFEDWLKINDMEKKLGEMMNKPREKFVSLEELLEVARQTVGTN